MTKPNLIILVGGKGTRLKELTRDKPKPMVDICGKPFLYWLIQYYHNQGFRDITLSTGYKEEVIRNYPWPWKLEFRVDDISWGNEWVYKKEHTWIVNGDTWIDSPLPEVHHRSLILTHNDVDSGAQYTGLRSFPYPITHQRSSVFYDIGTPEGLERFREYCMTHLVNRS